jgi:predicted aspartyl protease
MKPTRLPRYISVIAIGAIAVAIGCGSTSSTPVNNSSGSGTTAVNNVDAISVNTGLFPNEPYVDAAFTSVTVCVPGSTTSCQTIPDILVDTGSAGLRIVSSALTISLPQTTVSGNPIVECYPFSDSEIWGPVVTADMTIAGEQAKSLPIQVVGSSNFATVPAGCTDFGGPIEDTVADFFANGVLGVSPAVQDCGEGCTLSGAANFGQYFSCPASGTCEVIAYPLASQVPNPVSLFATDNNGVLVELPAVSVTAPQTSVSGSLIFGIGTQSNNALGSATVYNVDPSTDLTLNTIYSGQLYSDNTILDTGSNGLYIVDYQVLNPTNAPLGVQNCADASFLYCPGSTTPLNFSATNQGFSNGATGTVNFSIGNADTLTANPNDAAVNGLGGTSGTLLGFDWGLPFFFGRNVFVAMDGKSTPGGTGPYVAY